MEPVPETVEAVAAMEEWGETGLLAGLLRLADQALAVVPDLLGVSITRLDEDLTFTLIASQAQVAVLDAVQYLAGGPCADGADTQQRHAPFLDRAEGLSDDGALDEERWRWFAEAAAANGVRSTLTLPLRTDAGSRGSVNLYAASAQAFTGQHDRLAAVFGAWAEGAVANADLDFDTRRRAAAAPAVIRELTIISAAVGVLAARLDISVEQAEAHLLSAAERAAVSPVDLARVLVEDVRPQEE